MCGRYASFLPAEALARIFATANPLPNLPARWNLAPSQDAPVVRRHPDSGARHLDLLRWGLLPYWTKDPAKARRPINARAETLASSGMFRDAFARRRCLVPADAFYEWQKRPGGGTKPFAAARADGVPLALGGVWEGFRAPDGSVIRSFAIVTTAASEAMRPIHPRMPLVLEPADWPVWLGEEDGDPAALLRPAGDVLRVWPVGTAVNAPRNEGADLLAPLADAGAEDAPSAPSPTR